ncbi:MAG: Mur ligase family protein, partial [Patescibacteria group bacterium]|nr:Mur ligase family protein [Patescibacteria group bacterium]
SKLDWTIRSGLIFVLCVLLIILPAIAIFYFSGLSPLLIFSFFCFMALPFIVVFVDILISPLVLFQKNKIVNHAKKIVQSNKQNGLITIGITGSFGKTSMKNVLVNISGEKYKIFTFHGNINTDIGTSRYLIKHQERISKANILISEMGAYKKGDIKKLCDIVNPDYSITTSIGESHLERFGSFKNIVSAKFELANATKKKIFLNICDENIKKYSDLKIDNNIEVIKVCGNKEVKNMRYLENFAGISFEYSGQIFKTKIIADYIIDFSIIAFKIANELKLNISEMKTGFEKMDFVPHRLEVIKNKKLNRTVIDDSYNGNYAGFLIGLDILNRSNGRKIVLTPGIVELGKKRSKEIHFCLSEKYAENVDLTLLVKNKNTDFIVDKFKKIGYNSFKIYKTVKEAHSDLANVLKNGDTIIFQNDITDNYL